MEANCTCQSAIWMIGGRQGGRRFTCFIESVSNNKDNRELKFRLNGQNAIAIEAISIRHSSIPRLPSNLAITFPNFTFLNIHNCGLTEISRSDLIGLEGLVDLDLRANKLTSLPRDLLTDMKKLKYILLHGNQIATLDVRMFDGIKNQLELLELSRNGLIDDTYKRGGKQTIDEFLKVVATKLLKPEMDESKSFPQKLSEGFKDLWLTHRFSDFTIVVDGKEFKVHKSVLAIQSKVFSEMFEEKQEGKSINRLTILKFTAEAFEDFLRFLYTGKIGNRDNAMELFSLATIYEVADLKSMAENIIWNKVDESNAMEVFSLANHCRSEELMTKSFAAIKRAHPEINFDESLIRKPQDVQNLIQARQEYEKAVENARKKLEEATMKTF